MPAFRSRSFVEIARGVRAYMEVHAGVVRGDVAGPDGDRGAEPGEARKEFRRARERLEHQAEKKARRRGREQKTTLRSKRQELSQIIKELDGAKREADKSEQLEQVKRTKKKKQEIFRLRNKRRAANSGALGALPDFVVIGGTKCGTTFFYHLLTKHPYVEPAAFKELRYFDLLFDEGTEWYRQCFPPPTLKNGRRTITGEGTPGYLFHPQVPQRMAEVVPRARLIALLRNPVDRTYSAYHHQERNRPQPLTFEETVEACLDGSQRKLLSQSIYVDHLLRWSGFFSREQMLVLKSEDFFEDPRETMQLVLGFLDLPEWEPEAADLGEKVNKGGYDQGMSPEVRKKLEKFFEPHNRRLYDYLGVDFGW